VPKAELVKLVQEAAALLFPTRHEGFGLPVVEAMAAGTPVVATPDPAVREVGGDAVAYAESRELGSVLINVLANPEPWTQAGLARATLHSWESVAEITAGVYREVLG
jgi:alpha-1,3-rhamnosyl/mannosyltransferase